jgi:hypothetical protein
VVSVLADTIRVPSGIQSRWVIAAVREELNGIPIDRVEIAIVKTGRNESSFELTDS